MRTNGNTAKIVAGVLIALGIVIILWVVPPQVYLFLMGVALIALGVAVLIKKGGC